MAFAECSPLCFHGLSHPSAQHSAAAHPDSTKCASCFTPPPVGSASFLVEASGPQVVTDWRRGVSRLPPPPLRRETRLRTLRSLLLSLFRSLRFRVLRALIRSPLGKIILLNNDAPQCRDPKHDCRNLTAIRDNRQAARAAIKISGNIPARPLEVEKRRIAALSRGGRRSGCDFPAVRKSLAYRRCLPECRVAIFNGVNAKRAAGPHFGAFRNTTYPRFVFQVAIKKGWEIVCFAPHPYRAQHPGFPAPASSGPVGGTS